MISQKRICSTIFLIIVSILLFSCGASHRLKDESIYQANDFSFTQLWNQDLIIGGVSSWEIDITPENRIKYSSILSNIILEDLKDVHKIDLINTMQFVEI
jgi:hypothetical protein